MTTVNTRGSEFTTYAFNPFAALSLSVFHSLSQPWNLPLGSSRSSANHELVSRAAVKGDDGIAVTAALLLVMLFISPLRHYYSSWLSVCGCGVYVCVCVGLRGGGGGGVEGVVVKASADLS